MSPLTPSPLTSSQARVLALISAGWTVTHAAQSAGVHRNTIYNWMQSSQPFREALASADPPKPAAWRGGGAVN